MNTYFVADDYPSSGREIAAAVPRTGAVHKDLAAELIHLRALCVYKPDGSHRPLGLPEATTGRGHVAFHRGDYHDAIYNKKNHVVPIISEVFGGVATQGTKYLRFLTEVVDTQRIRICISEIPRDCNLTDDFPYKYSKSESSRVS